MSYKKLVVVLSSIFLLAMATGTARANDPIVFAERIPPRQPAPTIQNKIAASGNIGLYSSGVASSCTTGLFDATLPQKLSLVSSGSSWLSALLANENGSHAALVRTGIFASAEEKVTPNRPVLRVQTGVFWGPRGLPDKGQDYNLGFIPKLGLFGLPYGLGVGDRTGQRHDFQIIQRRNP